MNSPVKCVNLGLLLEFWEDPDFPTKINLGDFSLKKLDPELIETLIKLLGDKLTNRDKERWRDCKYGLVREYVANFPKGDELQKDLGRFHRFSQVLRIMRESPVVTAVVEYRESKRGIDQVQYRRSNPDKVHPLRNWELNKATFTRQDTRKFKKYNDLCERVNSISTYDKLSSALYFFENFYHTTQIRPRIVVLVSALESLFNSGSDDASYKIRARCAAFLEKNPVKRKELFDALNDVYKLRSKIVHGQALGRTVYTDPESAIQLVGKAEDYTRRCLRTIIDKNYNDFFSRSDKIVGDELDEYVMGTRRS